MTCLLCGEPVAPGHRCSEDALLRPWAVEIYKAAPGTAPAIAAVVGAGVDVVERILERLQADGVVQTDEAGRWERTSDVESSTTNTNSNTKEKEPSC